MMNRRQWFQWGIQGLGATASIAMLLQDRVLAGQSQDSGAALPVKAKRAIHICLVGGLSHLDSFDYKPELDRLHGKSFESEERPDLFFGQVGLLRKSDWQFRQRGQSGLWISELFPKLAELADDLTILNSLESKTANHTPALFMANSGFEFAGFPSMGSWISYGMGLENETLPAYVVLNDERGAPNTGASTWSSAFLPSNHQGVVFRNGDRPVRDLFPALEVDEREDQAVQDFVQQMNRADVEKRVVADSLLQGRLRSYELAAKMQTSIPQVSSFTDETAETLEMYGVRNPETADMGRRCLLGRRLLEQGVRFVQLFSGGPVAGNPRASWDAHEDVVENHSIEAGRIDQPVAALLQDLKQRGMLDDTLVVFTTEFGRTPFSQSGANEVGKGRDHNRYGFSGWMAGAGLKAGISYGATDEIGWRAVENPVAWHDLHATILYLFGIDHRQLTFYHNGIERRLTNVHGNVIQDILS